MNIVINTSPLLSAPTGVGSFIHHAAAALRGLDKANHYTYYYGYFSDELAPMGAADDGSGSKRFGAMSRTKKILDAHPTLRGLARKVVHGYHRVAAGSREFDLYYEPNYIPVDIMARRVVATVHDLSLHFHPEWHPLDRVAHFARHFAERIERADVVTVDSDFTRRELLAFPGLNPAKIRVVYPGCDHGLFRPRAQDDVGRFRKSHDLDVPFVLFVGSIEPRKNLDRLLDAWEQLPAALRGEFRLVLAGFAGWKNKPVMRRIAAMKDSVTFLGYLDAKDLARCYAAATLFVYPSLYEGFGLPPIEAMASGTPVVASDIEPLREVCQDAASFVDPLDPGKIAAGIEKALTDESLRRGLIEKGVARAKAFTWESTAQGLLGAFVDANK